MFYQCQEYEEHYAERQQGSAPIADKRKGYADYRHQFDGHSYVYEHMHKETGSYAIAVYPVKWLPAALRQLQDISYQEDKEGYENEAAYESKFFSYGAEDKVRALLRNETVGGLSPFQVALPL